jgi:transcriptional regulator with XRE-family HTH domain
VNKFFALEIRASRCYLDSVRPQHPFKILRKFLKGHPDLRQASTQQGFAALVDCSRSLIRLVEQEQTKITEKLAKKVQAATGVPLSWLATKHDPELPVPGEDGTPLTHEAVISRIKREISQNLEEASVNLLVGSKAVIERSNSAKDPSDAIRRRMASTMAKVVEEALYLSFDRGDTRLMEEITRLLAGQGTSKE